MPMLASTASVRPGIGAGRSGFSAKAVTRIDSSTLITPNERAWSSGTSTQPTVMSAPRRTWSARSFE